MDHPNLYDQLGEFHDLFMTEAWEALRPLVVAAFGRLRPEAVVLEVGAGSGLGTRVLAQETRAQIVALEPNLLMRSILTARVADDVDLAHRVTVVAGSVPQDLSVLPDRVDAVVCTHVLGHLDADERRSLFTWVADRLDLHGAMLVTTQEHADSTDSRAPDLTASRMLGRYEYRLLYREAGSQNMFSSRYEVWDGASMLRAVEMKDSWQTVGLGELEASLEETGLSVVPLRPGAALIRFPRG